MGGLLGTKLSRHICRFLVLSFLSFSRGELFGDEISRPKEEPWESTALSFDFFSNFLNDQTCFSNPAYFAGCFFAAHRLLHSIRSDLDLELADIQAKTGFLSSEVLESFGPLLISKSSKIKDPRGDTLESAGSLRNREQRRLVLQELESFYNKNFLPRKEALAPDVIRGYRSVLAWIHQEILRSGKDQKTRYVEPLNTFFQIAEDPHTILVDQTFRSETLNPSDGVTSEHGLGLQCETMDSKLYVVNLAADGPAERAGIIRGDRILTIDNRLVTSIFEMGEALNSKKEVTIEIERNGRRLSISVKMGKFFFPHYEVKIVNEERFERPYTVLKISSFRGWACKQLTNEIEKKLSASSVVPYGIILDMRDNLGGLTDNAICVVGLLKGPFNTVSTMEPLRRGFRRKILISENSQVLQGPVVSVVNHASKSVSEMLAAALQDMGEFVVGDRTGGKGSAQQLFHFLNASTKIDILRTTHLFFSPLGWSPQIQGVTPNLFAYQKPDGPTESEKNAIREEQMFLRVIPNPGRKWKESRPDQVAKMKKCIEEKGNARKQFSHFFQHGDYFDHQQAYAVDTLYCS